MVALREAGWWPGRRDADMVNYLERHGVPRDHPAYALLAEFGALNVGEVGPGVQCSRSNVYFDLLAGDDPSVTAWADILRTHLVGVAWEHDSHGQLYLAQDGRVFGNSLVHDAFCFLGNSMAEALTRLLRGLRAAPMLRPDQQSVMFYGETLTEGDPRAYRWKP